MYRALTCLAYEHDHRLVLLAVCICVLGAITSIRVLQLAAGSGSYRRAAWLLTAALSAGSTIWSTHFISMLAYDPGVGINYDLKQTFLSLLVAVAMSFAAFAVSMRPEKAAPYIGGAMFGLGVAAMHYVGMGAVQAAGRLVWDAGIVAMSVGYAVMFGVFALVALRRLPGERGLLSGSAAIIAGVALLHFTGMGAVTVVPDPSIVVEPSLVPSFVLGSASAFLACFMLAIALLCVIFDNRMAKDHAEAERRIRHMAYHDALTGLPNRTFLSDALREHLETAELTGSEVALLTIDLDRFKQVNDLFGHKTGDALLVTVSRLMLAVLQPGEVLARVGGDEFVVIQSGAAQPMGAEDLAKRLIGAVCRDVDVEGAALRTALSIGIALYPRDGKDASTLHPNADAALYRAKQEGRGTYRFFEAEMDLAARERRALQLEMRDALKRGEFKLYYQPQAETATGVISGFEALLRWDHPKRGIISPIEFISAAEDNGFIVELGEFVLRTACREASSWSRPLKIGVNLSPVQFQHGDIVALVRSVIAETGLDPKRLEIEITESLLIHDFAHALAVLDQIKQLGVGVAMDDFGTGYSSLAYLQAFPFDRIKIDRSFVAAVTENRQSEAIIRAVIGLGRGLNVPITAEGVETEAQQAFLAELDCTAIQGFLIGKPQPIELFAPYIGRVPEAGVRTAVA